MSEQPTVSAEQAFEPKVRQGDADWNAYLESRPYQDVKGNVHNPASGSFIDAEQHFADRREAIEAEGQIAYTEMPTTVLARKLAEAEFSEDRTMAASVEDALLDKIAAQDERENERDPERSGQQTDKLIDYVMSIKDRKLNDLKENAKPDDDTPESKEKSKVGTKVYYEPNEDGIVQTAVEITEEGDSVDLNDMDNPWVLVTTKNRTYFVNGKDIDDLTLLKKQDHEPGEVDNWAFEDGEKLPTVRIGDRLNIKGKNIDGPITKIEIEHEQVEADELGDEYEARGEDPFKKADELVDEVYPNEAETEHIDVAGLGLLAEESPQGLRQRASYIMRRARVFMRMKQHETAMYITDEENRRKVVAGGVLGFFAMAGAAYAGLKGVPFLSSGSHGSEALPLTMKPHHHEAVRHMEAVTRKDGGTVAPGQRAVTGANGGTIAHEVGQHKDALSLSHEGDTIESQIAGYLHTDLKDPAVTKVTEVVLHNQGISWNDARHLPIGYNFNMPPQHVIEELLKTSSS